MEASRSGRPPTRQAGPPRYLHRTAGSQQFWRRGITCCLSPRCSL